MCGFAVNAITGVSIFMKDAASYGINLDLHVTLLFRSRRVGVAGRHPTKSVQPPGDRQHAGIERHGGAGVGIACVLAGAIIAGRLIAYLGPIPGL